LPKETLVWIRIQQGQDPDPNSGKNQDSNQCCRSGLDPDSQSGSGSKRATIAQKNRKQLINSYFEVLNILF
jgi:hypothetical protein